MYNKHFTVSFIVLVTAAISLQLVRGQDCDPTSGCNDQSYCVANGYCSCLSGFSGDSCAVPPQSSCISSYKEPSLSKQGTLDSQLEFSLTLNMLNIQINASLEKNRYKDSSASPLEEDSHDSTYSLGTTITWSDSSSCDYPSSLFWTKAAVADGLCLDSYTLKMAVDDAISSCGFKLDPATNAWSSDVIVTRYYSQPPDMSIIDPSRRVEGRPMISVESKIFTITFPSGEAPKTQAPATDTNEEDSSDSVDEEEEQAPSSEATPGSSYDRALFIKIAAALAGAVGLTFIAAVIVVIAVRRRRSRKAQAQFNFEGIDSN